MSDTNKQTPIEKQSKTVLFRSFKLSSATKAVDLGSQGQLIQTMSPLLMCCVVGDQQSKTSLQTNPRKKTTLFFCFNMSQVKHHIRLLQLRLSFNTPRLHSFSPGENITRREQRGRGGRGERVRGVSCAFVNGECPEPPHSLLKEQRKGAVSPRGKCK